MKVRVEVDEKTEDVEVVVRCNDINDEVIRIQTLLSGISPHKPHIMFYKNEQEYYIPLSDILFF